jgi:hypothetical protein
LNKSSNEAKVNAAMMFLIETIKLWWRNGVEDLEARRINENIQNLE